LNFLPLPQARVTATDFATAAWLLYPSREHLPSKVRVAIDFLKRHVGSEPNEWTSAAGGEGPR